MGKGLLRDTMDKVAAYKQRLTEAGGRTGTTTTAAAKPAPAAPRKVPANRNTPGPVVTTSAQQAAKQKKTIQERVAARVAANKGKPVKRKKRVRRNEVRHPLRSLRGGM